jgi:hypothetical protein
VAFLIGPPLRAREVSKEQLTPVEGPLALSLDALTSVATARRRSADATRTSKPPTDHGGQPGVKLSLPTEIPQLRIRGSAPHKIPTDKTAQSGIRRYRRIEWLRRSLQVFMQVTELAR